MSGGAWKVAYADFVTAMMALFMVLWISSQDEKILIATSSYFQNPFNAPVDATSGVLPFNSKKQASSEGKGTGPDKESERNKMVQMAMLNSVAADFKRLLHLDQDLNEKPIDIQVTSDGLRVTLFDRARQRVFEGDTAEFTEWGTFVLQTLAWNIDRHSLRVTIDGHTRTGLGVIRDKYSAWELSADRANAARRGLVHFAVAPELIDRVTGFADTRPVEGEPPESEANQRIALSLAFGGKSKPAPNRKGGGEPTKQSPAVSIAPAPEKPLRPPS